MMNHPTKAELRRLLKERRAALSPDEKKELDRAMIEHVAASPLFQNASALLLYVPMEGEINFLPLARMARKRGIPIAFPKCRQEDNTMAFYTLTEDARLSPGAYGIPEPPEGAPLCVPDERALCILPGLSFDVHGNRLGYGKGYYDRYLASFPGVTLGAVYAHLVLREIPADEYDIPTQHLVTEQGFYELTRPEPLQINDFTNPAEAVNSADYAWENADQQEAEQAISAQTPAKTVEPFPLICRRIWHLMWQTEHTEGVKTLHAPAALVLCTFVLLLLSRLIDAHLLDRSSEYLGVILLQILIFILPAILYCKLRGEKFTDRIRIAPIRPAHPFLLLCILVMMITGGLLTSILTGGIASLEGNFTLYNTFIARTSSTGDILYAILAYAILPAFGEELVFRSILCAEYEKNGVGVSIVVSALFFAMLHFSFPLFLTYFALGLLLAASMYATRSFFAPLCLHLLYNVFCLFGQPYLSAFYINAGSTEIFLFCLIVLFLLFSALAAGEARKIYHIYAIKNTSATYAVSRPIKQYPRAILFSVFSPLCAVCLIVFLITAIVNLF